MPFFLGVESVTRYQGSFELGRGVFVKKALGDRKFAVVFFAAVGALGEGLASGVEAKGDNAAESAFGSDAFAVQREGFGKQFAVFHKPGVEGTGEFDRVDAVDDVIECTVTGHGEESGFGVFARQADGTALVLIEGGAFLPDRFDVLCTADQPIDKEGEHGAEGVADGFGIAGVGESLQRVAQRAQLGTFQGAAGTGGVAIGNGGLVGRRQEPGAGEQGECIFFQGPNPEMLGFSGILIEVAAVSFEAFGEAEWLPVGGFVKGARVFIRIVKTFGKKGMEAVPGFKLASEGAQGKCEALAGEIGAAGAVDDVEAAQLHDELEAVGAGNGVPADMIVTFLETLGGSAPTEDGDQFGAVCLGVGSVDSLPKDVPGGASGLEIVPLVEGLAKMVDFGFLGGGAQYEVVNNEGGFGHQCVHGRLNLPKQRHMSSDFSKIQ